MILTLVEDVLRFCDDNARFDSDHVDAVCLFVVTRHIVLDKIRNRSGGSKKKGCSVGGQFFEVGDSAFTKANVVETMERVKRAVSGVVTSSDVGDSVSKVNSGLSVRAAKRKRQRQRKAERVAKILAGVDERKEVQVSAAPSVPREVEMTQFEREKFELERKKVEHRLEMERVRTEAYKKSLESGNARAERKMQAAPKVKYRVKGGSVISGSSSDLGTFSKILSAGVFADAAPKPVRVTDNATGVSKIVGATSVAKPVTFAEMVKSEIASGRTVRNLCDEIIVVVNAGVVVTGRKTVRV